MWNVNVVRMTTLLLKGRDPIDLLYSKSEVEWICVGRGRCKWIDFTIVHSSSRLDNYIMLIVKFIFQWFQYLRLLSPNPYGKFIGDCLGLGCFWLVKGVSWLGGRWQSISIVEDHIVLLGEERSTNVTSTEEAWGYGLRRTF